jgi:hypothetical protein
MAFGLIGGLAKGLGGGLLKGAGGLLKGGGGELLKGIAGKGVEIAQGAIQNAIQGGGEQKGAEGAGNAEGAQPAQKGDGKKGDPIARLAQKIEQATSKEDVERIVKKVSERLEKKGKLDPETKKIIEALAQNKIQTLGGAGGGAPEVAAA